MSNIAPCPYPGCRDLDGNPRLTRDVICDASRRHYWSVLERLGWHYVQLRATMPAPAAPPGERVMRVVAKEYGHPAEWASDKAREIADFLGGAHDELAEQLDHDPHPHPGTREAGRVGSALHYLTSWFGELCTLTPNLAEPLYDLDRSLRSGLGQTDPRRFLPCPECDVLGLVRELDGETGDDHVDCHACGASIPHELYSHWTRVLLDDLIEQEQRQAADDEDNTDDRDGSNVA